MLSPHIGTSTVEFAPADVEAVQIHNNDCLHWLTSTVGIFNPSCVEILDSLSSGHLSLSLRRQLSDLYRLVADDDGKIRTVVTSVQQQRLGKENCGLYAIAFATSICYGVERSRTSYSEHSLRSHFHQCLESGTMTPFPESKLSVRRTVKTKVQISIHCTCFRILSGSKMIQCNSCNNWFHVKCVSRPKERARIVRQATWSCHSCLDRSI